jgi:two-component system cell cycle response regulator
MLSSVSVPTAAPPRVLVVDDSAVIRQAIEKMLKKDFELVLAEDGEAGWGKLAQDGRIRALITDIEMPRLDGYGFICRIRAADDPRIRDLPIITITGAEDEETRMRAYACGATDFITKPLNPGQLQARVHAYLDMEAVSPETAPVPDDQAIDPLTGLHGRRYFMQRGTQAIQTARASAGDVSLIRLDIDQFKKIYEKHGDDVVDQMLMWLAKLLNGAAGPEHTVARIGGAEFAILAPSLARPDALALCDRVRAAIAGEPFEAGRTAISVNVSMGVASLGADRREDTEGLLTLAEQRLAHAKSEGGNRVSASALRNDLPPPEEVVLAAVEERSAPGQAQTLALPEVEELSIAELEDLVKQETAKPTSSRAAAADLLALVSVDKALQLLARGEREALSPYFDGLMVQVLPLLEAYNELERLGWDAMLETLRERMTGRGR